MENDSDLQDSVDIEDDEIDRVIDINDNDVPEGELRAFFLKVQNYERIVFFSLSIETTCRHFFFFWMLCRGHVAFFICADNEKRQLPIIAWMLLFSY